MKGVPEAVCQLGRDSPDGSPWGRVGKAGAPAPPWLRGAEAVPKGPVLRAL